MRIILVLTMAIPATMWGQIQPPSGKVDSLMVSTILYDVLDTIAVNLDSSAFQNPYSYWPQHLRPAVLDEVLRAGFTFQPASAYFKGALDAIADLRKPYLSLKTYGSERILKMDDGTSWQVEPILSWILRIKHSVELEAIAGDQVNPWIVAYAKGYNQIAQAVINRYFGRDVKSLAFDQISATIKDVGISHPEWQATP